MKIIDRYRYDLLFVLSLVIVISSLIGLPKIINYYRYLPAEGVPWVSVDAISVDWDLGPGPTLSTNTWSVKYIYIANGTQYSGDNIDFLRKTFNIRKGYYRALEIERLLKVRKVWYNPAAPTQSFMFKKGMPPPDVLLRGKT